MPPVELICSTTMSTPMRSRAPSIAPVPVISSSTPILMGEPLSAAAAGVVLEDEVGDDKVVGVATGAADGAEQPATRTMTPTAAGSPFKHECTRTYASNPPNVAHSADAP